MSIYPRFIINNIEKLLHIGEVMAHISLVGRGIDSE